MESGTRVFAIFNVAAMLLGAAFWPSASADTDPSALAWPQVIPAVNAEAAAKVLKRAKLLLSIGCERCCGACCFGSQLLCS